MRLLQYCEDGELSLTKNFIDKIPPYAILSHTWGPDTEEVSFGDLMDCTGKDKAGYKKIRFCAEQAKRNDFQYFWVDTCCIDKSNNTELSEAINSMYRWYRNAAKCYVYLSDVPRSAIDTNCQSTQLPWASAFRQSRWFTRGWTLQELIAPMCVEFFSRDWDYLGDKKSLERHICEITGIPAKALRGNALSDFSVPERMSWADKRETTRREDLAYSLLGIFDISMPLIYGEGAENAFDRLREEIYKRGRKHQLDEVSTVSHTFDPVKRSKVLYSQSSAVPSGRDPSLLDPKLPFYSQYSVYSDNIPEAGKEPITSIDTTIKQSLIDQLYFTKIDERLTSLTAAQGTTCRWLLTKHEYTSWCDMAQQTVHGGFLWIKGNPGTGKSTLMKLLFEKAKLDANSNSLQITLSFFFLARGTVEEKSATGLYRSLLHQLFEKAMELRDSLEWMTSDGARAVQRSGWHEEALKQTLTHAIKRLNSRPLTMFIDALDECDDSQATSMVGFFEELCDIAREAKVQLKICFSSRHYPTVVIQKGIEVTLEDETGHTEDIEQYIKSKLRLGKSTQAESLRSEILKKSSGIFLWVVLVLDILNSEYPNSSISIKKIRNRLKEIPPKLTDLFEMMLTRDGQNLRLLQVCLKWILFATRPLKPQELYFAIQLSLNKECLSCWDQEDEELNQIKTFVRSSSKGLAEVTRNKASEVQFIHESVRDFLLGKYEGQWSGVSGNFVGNSHENLRNCCLAQLNAAISKDVDIPDPLPQASKAAQLRETINLKFPFLEYSVFNVLRHANNAQENAMDQGDFLTDFPLQRWIFLNNTLERYDVRRYSESVSLLYILAEKNLDGLIRIHPQRKFCFDVENERYGLPIFAALATGSREAAQTFLEIQAEIQPQESPLHHLYKQYSKDRNKLTKFDRNFAFSPRRSVFSYIVDLDDEVIFTFLCASGKLDIKSKDKCGRTPLLWATINGYEAVVKLLLEKDDVTLNIKDNDGRTPLLLAMANGHEAVVKLLLEKGADLKTPLLWAAANGQEAVVTLLLEKGAELEAKDNNNGQTPLLWAAINGREEVAKLLLEKGSELEAKDYDGRTPLLWAAVNGHEVVVKLLLEKDAKLEAKNDKTGRTPLLWAAVNGHEEVVKLLLEKGSELEAKNDENGRTPLLWAAVKGHKEVVKLLLEKGSELETKDKNDRTPLSWAVEKKHEEVVKLLLEKGAELEMEDKDGRTPLSYATNPTPTSPLLRYQMQLMQLEKQNKHRLMMARQEQDNMVSHLDSQEGTRAVGSTGQQFLQGGPRNSFNLGDQIKPYTCGYEGVINLLLKNGAELETKDKDGWTPLLHASKTMQEAVVRLLLDKGANLEAKDNYGRTSLLWAAANGHKEVVKLLLENSAELETKDRDSRTPLSCAEEMKHEEVVKLLLEKGAKHL